MGRKVNKAELEQILGLSHTTLTEYQAEGLPIEKRGERGQEHEYDTAAVIEWLVNRALVRAGKSKSALELEVLELNVRELRAKDALREKTLVPTDEVRPVWEGRVLAAAAFMRSRASKLAGELEATPGLEAKRDLLRKADAAFLTHLGVEGERMQAAIEALLEKVAAGEADAFLRRISGHDNPPDSARPPEGGVG